MVEAGKDYEERVAFLLKQLTNKTLANTSNPGASGTGNDLVDTVKDADIQKFSMIQKALQEMKQEAETNKKVKKENDLKRRETKVEERYTMEEFFNERFSDSDESEEDDDESEAEWGQTPLRHLPHRHRPDRRDSERQAAHVSADRRGRHGRVPPLASAPHPSPVLPQRHVSQPRRRRPGRRRRLLPLPLRTSAGESTRLLEGMGHRLHHAADQSKKVVENREKSRGRRLGHHS